MKMGYTDGCSAFNAIISSSVVALDLSYAMPIAVNCLRGRKTLPDRRWKVPGVVGWVIDIVRLLSFSIFSFVLSFVLSFLPASFLWLLADNTDFAVLHCFDHGAFPVSSIAGGDREQYE